MIEEKQITEEQADVYLKSSNLNLEDKKDKVDENTIGV